MEIYKCDICQYKTNSKYNYKQHLLSLKHIKFESGINSFDYSCRYCKKEYVRRNSLWYHEQKCEMSKNTIIQNNDLINLSNPDLVLTLLQ
jgi:hypothetical protein